MKVLSHLEYNKLFTVDSNKGLDYGRFVNSISGRLNIVDFYSQKFRPSIIRKYFEGWNKLTPINCSDYWFYESDLDDVTITFYKTEEIIEYGGIQSNTLPRTLDEFIVDCQRAGIELIWKNI